MGIQPEDAMALHNRERFSHEGVTSAEE